MKIVLGEQLFTIDEVADMLGVTRATVSSYIKKGMLIARPLGVRKYITEDAIRAFLHLPSKVGTAAEAVNGVSEAGGDLSGK